MLADVDQLRAALQNNWAPVDEIVQAGLVTCLSEAADGDPSAIEHIRTAPDGVIRVITASALVALMQAMADSRAAGCE